MLLIPFKILLWIDLCNLACFSEFCIIYSIICTVYLNAAVICITAFICCYEFHFFLAVSSLISLECAERPNYFLYVHNDNSIFLAQWDASLPFRRRTTFIHHQGLWISSYSTFELHSKRGFFLTLSTSAVKISKFDGSEEFKSLSSFSIEGELHIMV